MKQRFAALVFSAAIALPAIVAAAAPTQTFAALWLESNPAAQTVITGGLIDGFSYGYLRGAEKFVAGVNDVPIRHATFSRGIAFYRDALETYYTNNPLSQHTAGTLLGCLADDPSYSCKQFQMADPAPLAAPAAATASAPLAAPAAKPAAAPAAVQSLQNHPADINRAEQWAGWSTPRRNAFMVGALYGYGNGFVAAQSALAPSKEFTDAKGSTFSKTPLAYIAMIDAFYRAHPQSHAQAIEIAACFADARPQDCDELERL